MRTTLLAALGLVAGCVAVENQARNAEEPAIPAPARGRRSSGRK